LSAGLRRKAETRGCEFHVGSQPRGLTRLRHTAAAAVVNLTRASFAGDVIARAAAPMPSTRPLASPISAVVLDWPPSTPRKYCTAGPSA